MHSLKWYLEGVWLPIHARFVGMSHWVRGHDLRWRENAEWWIGEFGWIECHDCPDCDGRSVAIWNRHWRIWWRLAIWLCSLRGHQSPRHPTKYIDGEHVPILDEWYCGNCLGDLTGAQAIRAPERKSGS